jgi:hypothetical protein
MEAVAAACASTALANSTTTKKLAQTTATADTATAPIVLAKVKKEMMPEALAAESKKQRKLDLAKVKEKAMTKELELKVKKCKVILLVEESKIMMADSSALDPARKAWFENKQGHDLCTRCMNLYLLFVFDGHKPNHVTGLNRASADLITIYVIYGPSYVNL